ncbi:hypothetical protein BJX66DRAFT_317394 [Aspergillus keveii]|uniref:SRPBCC family protein n=1 Tax=Aspergillus keveii TaxID=714993 RepID=A0ABR4FLC9_9EURO
MDTAADRHLAELARLAGSIPLEELHLSDIVVVDTTIDGLLPQATKTFRGTLQKLTLSKIKAHSWVDTFDSLWRGRWLLLEQVSVDHLVSTKTGDLVYWCYDENPLVWNAPLGDKILCTLHTPRRTAPNSIGSRSFNITVTYFGKNAQQLFRPLAGEIVGHPDLVQNFEARVSRWVHEY